MSLKDYSGRTLQVEPLVTIDGLEKFLNGRVNIILMFSVLCFVLGC